MSSYTWPEQSSGSGSGVSIYANLAAFPVSAPVGTLGVAADSGILYEYFGGSWQAIGAIGDVLALGSPLNGLNLTANVLTIGLSSASTIGALSATDWSTFNSKQASLTIGNLTDAGTDGITIGSGTGAVIGSGTTISQHVADTSHNGYLSSTDWNTFNGKQASLTIGDLTDAGTDGIVVTGGVGSVIGSGTSLAQHVADSSHNGYLSSTDWTTFNGKQASGSYLTALTGDGTASGPGSSALTLATVNSNVGSFGSSTAIPSITVNAKGLVTAASTNAVIAPAGTLTGTTLASNVVTSSLTSVGTIATGVWNGTTIAIANGGTGQTTKAPAFDALSPMTTGGDIIYGGASGTGTRLSNGSAGEVLTSNGTTLAPSWQAVAGSSGLEFYISSQVTTDSSAITVTGFTTFSNSPALSFTPVLSGTYKVYCSIPENIGTNGSEIISRVVLSSGTGTLLAESDGVMYGSSAPLWASVFVQSVYTLTAGAVATFDIQAKAPSSGAGVINKGVESPFYMFAERMGN